MVVRAADETDVLVIGSGMGGAAVSLHLGEAGIKVTCLEQGGWVHAVDHPHFHTEWEIEKQRGWAFDPNVRKFGEDYPVTGHTTCYMYNAVGGSTVHYAGHWPRFKPVDFRKGTEHGLEGTIDWPITYEELAPFYDMNDADIGVSGSVGDTGYPERTPRHGPPVPPGKLGLRIAEGMDRLGWHWWPSDNAILTRAKDGRLPCNACGNCLSGCPRGSLGTVDVSHWPKAIGAGVDLRTNARVEQITLGKDGLADGAVYIDRLTGERHAVRARMVVLSANGIGTPRMLLMSAQKGHQDGLANANGLVGTHLMHHSWAFIDCWFEEPLEGYKGAFGAPLYCQEFYDTGTDHDFVNGFTMQVGRSYGSAYTAMGTHTGNVAPWGKDHRKFFNDHFGHHLLVFMQGEDLPVRSNRVTLDPVVKDSDGLPAAHVNYEVPENDARLTDFGCDRIVEVAEAVNAIETKSTGVLSPPPGWHLMGTCRMGNTPEDSVTNKYNQTWEVPNLFLADGSSLTTGAGVNPTCTIGAVAVRCAEYIKRNHGAILAQKKTPRNGDGPGF
jgi:choline dehydrogenase-like flavoprotein